MDKQKIQQLLPLLLILIFAILLFLALLSTDIRPLLEGTEPQSSVTDMARSRIHIGDTRESAIKSLPDAWFHTQCPYTNTTMIDDLFFYGPRTQDEVEIVLIGSKETSGQVRVEFVGGVENYQLHLYEHCDPSPSSAFVK